MATKKTNIVHLSPSITQEPLVQDSYDAFRGQGTPLIIDNGSTTLRYGFCTSEKPYTGTNVIARYKDRKTNRPVLLFGDSVELDSGARAQARSAWEGDILLNFDALENALDHAFVHLNIDDETISHPVLMTERLCSPLHSRVLNSELMFEQYQVPALGYCIDGLMSFFRNNFVPDSTPFFNSDGIVISFNTASTSVIPMMDGKGLLSHAKRIPWGASQATDYLQKLIQLKYPTFPARITQTHSSWMFQNLCSFAPDYIEHLRELRDPLKLRTCDVIVQFPFVAPIENEKTEEELARIAERRREQGKKLQEIAAQKRSEKLQAQEADLQSFTELKESKDEYSPDEWKARLRSEGFDSESALDSAIKKLETAIRKATKKDDDDEPMEEPSFPLLDVPDADLDEDQLKEKRKQRLMKAGWEARMRARQEKEKEREKREAEEKREQDERERNLVGWAGRLKTEHESTIGRIKERNRRKAALSDRKSAIAQARMKNIASLAADDSRVPKKRRKGGGEDMFGADDADWLIYKKINTATVSSDEEEDFAKLEMLESKLLAHDPTFTEDHTYAAITSQKSALMSAFRPTYEEGDAEGNVRLHLNTERQRVCEAWFSPGMAGVDSAGLGEVLQNVLARFSDPEKERLAKNVFVTGSPAQLPGLIARLQNVLRPILRPDMELCITKAQDPALDAWKGMALFARHESELKQALVTREEYYEWGGERIRKWWGGNWNSAV